MVPHGSNMESEMTQYDKMAKAELIEELRKKDKLFLRHFEPAAASSCSISGLSEDFIKCAGGKGFERIGSRTDSSEPDCQHLSDRTGQNVR
jgi:hypothetical protein